MQQMRASKQKRGIKLALFLPPGRNLAHDSGYTKRLQREPGSSRAPPKNPPSSLELQRYGSPTGGEPGREGANLGRGRDRGVRSSTEAGKVDARRLLAAPGAGRGGRGLIVWVGFPGFIYKHAHVTQPSSRVPESIGNQR